MTDFYEDRMKVFLSNTIKSVAGAVSRTSTLGFTKSLSFPSIIGAKTLSL